MRLALLLMLLPAPALASEWVSAMAVDGARLYVAASQREDDMEPHSFLLEIESAAKQKKIALPKVLLDREIFAIMPAGDRVAVLSQYVIEHGDPVKLSVYDRKTKKWSAPVTAKCGAVAAVKVEKSRVVLSCEDGATGELSDEPLALPKGVTLVPAKIALPQHAAKSKSFDASLEDGALILRGEERIAIEHLVGK